MNWLGELVSSHVEATDTVLDIGCGILGATGVIDCAGHLCVDVFGPYLDDIKGKALTVRLNATEVRHHFRDNSYDVVLLLDVVEHLEKGDAETLIKDASRIARRKVVIFTPQGLVEQHTLEQWGFDANEGQRHLCGFEVDELEAAGCRCSLHDNNSTDAGDHKAILGVRSL